MTTLLDIGSNILGGYEHLQLYENITSSDVLKIFVEPNPECWPIVEEKLSNISNGVLVKKAVSTVQGTANLITRADVVSDIAATIIGRDYLEASLAKCNMFVDTFNTYEIECITIAGLIQQFNINPENTILKLDAEGVEYEVLNDILDNDINFNKIYCEFHIHSDEDSDKKKSLLKRFVDKGINIIDWQ